MKANSSLLFPELSYTLMGILFKIQSKLGNTYQEKYYQRAIELELSDLKIPFQREKEIKLDYQGKKIGKYFLDFVIDGKIVLEVKAAPEITHAYKRQLLAYLKTANVKLGIVANFRTPRLTYCRLVSPYVKLQIG